MQKRADESKDILQEAAPPYRAGAGGLTDAQLSMLEDSATMTPWERILANDDLVNFGDSLHAAMEKRNAKPR